MLYVSHDRELIAETAQRIVTVEAHTVWVHGGGFATYHAARGRPDRAARGAAAPLGRGARAAQGAGAHAAACRPRSRPTWRAATGRCARASRSSRRPARRPRSRATRPSRCGSRAAAPASARSRRGARADRADAAVLGRGVLRRAGRRARANGAGKSHFLRLLAGDEVRHTGDWKLGARVVPGTSRRPTTGPTWSGRTPVDVLMREALERGQAMGALSRYGLAGQATQPFETLSGGQQARLQILLLELGGATMLLLDEPTDNLDLESAEALEEALEVFDGTVVAVTHDRWFARGFDRFLVFGSDGKVFETPSRCGTPRARLADASSVGQPGPVAAHLRLRAAAVHAAPAPCAVLRGVDEQPAAVVGRALADAAHAGQSSAARAPTPAPAGGSRRRRSAPRSRSGRRPAPGRPVQGRRVGGVNAARSADAGRSPAASGDEDPRQHLAHRARSLDVVARGLGNGDSVMPGVDAPGGERRGRGDGVDARPGPTSGSTVLTKSSARAPPSRRISIVVIPEVFQMCHIGYHCNV